MFKGQNIRLTEFPDGDNGRNFACILYLNTEEINDQTKHDLKKTFSRAIILFVI